MIFVFVFFYKLWHYFFLNFWQFWHLPRQSQRLVNSEIRILVLELANLAISLMFSCLWALSAVFVCPPGIERIVCKFTTGEHEESRGKSDFLEERFLFLLIFLGFPMKEEFQFSCEFTMGASLFNCYWLQFFPVTKETICKAFGWLFDISISENFPKKVLDIFSFRKLNQPKISYMDPFKISTVDFPF